MTTSTAEQFKRDPNQPSSASELKKMFAPVIQLPSGHSVRARRPGMEKFLASGFLPDPLAKKIKSMISDRTGKSATEADLLKDLDLDDIGHYMRAVDRMAAYCIVEPPVRWHERKVPNNPGEPVAFEDIPPDERDEAIVYTDELALEDKMFLFQWVSGGTADVQQFRTKSAAAVEALQPSGEVGQATE